MRHRTPEPAYDEDLAQIHDQGFGHLAIGAAKELLTQLKRQRMRSGVVVELGCGSGILAERLAVAGYEVLGFDQSASMIRLARRRVPKGAFHRKSFVDAEIPSCLAVTAIGEVFNYLFDRRNTLARLRSVFRKVWNALEPGGLLLFDVATPGRVPGGKSQRYFDQGDWACLVTAEEVGSLLTRQITSFRRRRATYRRHDEVHRLRLYEPDEIESELQSLGFAVQTLSLYGKLALPPGLVGFCAEKPSDQSPRQTVAL